MICVTLHNVKEIESSNAQVQLFARKREDNEFQQIAYVKYKVEEFVYLLDVNNSACYKDITFKSKGNILINFFATFLLFINSFSV